MLVATEGGAGGKKGRGRGGSSPGEGAAHGLLPYGRCCSAQGHPRHRGAVPLPAAALAELAS